MARTKPPIMGEIRLLERLNPDPGDGVTAYVKFRRYGHKNVPELHEHSRTSSETTPVDPWTFAVIVRDNNAAKDRRRRFFITDHGKDDLRAYYAIADLKVIPPPPPAPPAVEG